MNKHITVAVANYGIGDALNQRAFLVSYCKQKNIPTSSIAIYTDKYWWMFKDLGFRKKFFKPNLKKLVPYRNFGLFDLPKTSNCPELDKCIAQNAQIKYSFEPAFLSRNLTCQTSIYLKISSLLTPDTVNLAA